MVKVFGKKAMDIIIPKLDELLLQAKKQPKEPEVPLDSKLHQSIPKGAHIIQSIKHTDLLHGGGNPSVEQECLESDYKNVHVEPWESSDGALHLLNDLSEVCPKEIAKHISQLAELTSVTGFHHADCLKETIYMYLPTIMKNVGKAICKENLEFFYDDLFRAIKGQNHKLSAVASDCLSDICKLI